MFFFDVPPLQAMFHILKLMENVCSIALQNDTDMRTIEENYRLLERLVDEENIFLDPDFTFGRVCRLLGARRGEMDGRLKAEIGLEGEELFSALRAGFPGHLERKYGLRCFFQEL